LGGELREGAVFDKMGRGKGDGLNTVSFPGRKKRKEATEKTFRGKGKKKRNVGTVPVKKRRTDFRC